LQFDGSPNYDHYDKNENGTGLITGLLHEIQTKALSSFAANNQCHNFASGQENPSTYNWDSKTITNNDISTLSLYVDSCV
jgi:hypothetical protein